MRVSLCLSSLPCRVVSPAGMRWMGHGEANTAERKERGHWDSLENQRRFMDDVAKRLQVEKLSDWRKVTTPQLEAQGGGSLLRRYKGSFLALLQAVYPEQEPDAASCRPSVPQGYWALPENRRRFLEKFARERGIVDARGWKGVRRREVVAAGGSRLLTYSGSLFNALREAFPKQFSGVLELEARCHVGPGFWADPANHRRFLEQVRQQMGIQSPSDWKRVTSTDIIRLGGSRLLSFYPSLFDMLSNAYPEHSFSIEEIRQKKPHKHWHSRENCRTFLEKAAAELGFDACNPTAWKACTITHIQELGGQSMLRHYNGSLMAALQDTFPELSWDLFNCRASVTWAYWNSRENRREFVERLVSELSIDADSPEDWQRLTATVIAERGGSGLLAKYSGGVLEMLRDLYPEKEWSRTVCRGYITDKHWDHTDNVRNFLERIGRKLKVEEPRDWCRISVTQLRELNGGGLLKKMPLRKALALAFPGEKWDEVFRNGAFHGGKRSAQRQLKVQLGNIFHTTPSRSSLPVAV